MGYIEGRNVAIESRWAENDFSRLPDLAADLVRRRVAVIATVGTVAALTAKTATSTIPIVFSLAGDPVEQGIVASLNRPGGNLTGTNTLMAQVGTKQLGLIHELLPRANRFAVLINPGAARPDSLNANLQASAAAIGRKIEFFYAGTNAEIDTAFVNLVQKRTDALLVVNQFLFRDRRAQILQLAARHSMPTIYGGRADVEAGGLMSYGPDDFDSLQQTAIYIRRILNGEKPGDLPVVRSTKFEFVINLKTAEALGLTIPETLLATADEVIQ
jgi:putative ABC transport system substrate-binding protein